MAAIAASPTIIGAITTLIVVVAVFLAYNANNGLPFVPVYRVSVIVPNAARLAPNNEVRIGGSRVGVIESIDAVRIPENGGDPETTPVTAGEDTNGVVARLNLKLDKSASPIPVNSVFRIRYRSSFGLKYLEITRGEGPEAPEGFTFNGTNDNDDPGDDDNQILSVDEVKDNQGADDGTFIAQTEFDEIGNTFDAPTRNAIRENLAGYGDGFAGRGASLNQAFQALNPLLTNLLPVAQTLNDPRTTLSRGSSRPSPGPRRSSRRSPSRTPSSSATPRRRSRRSATTRRRCRRRSPAARRRCRRGSTCCRPSARSCATRPSSRAGCGPASSSSSWRCRA